MKWYKVIFILLLCGVVLMPSSAVAYQLPDQSRFHASSVYFLTLQDNDGKILNPDFAEAGAIGAFVGNELRGMSRLEPTTATASVFVVRVWGDENDPAQVAFRVMQEGKEHVVGIYDFGQGEDMTYGTASEPLPLVLGTVTLSFEKSTLNLSKLSDSSVTLHADGNFLPSGIELSFSKAANGEPVATAVMADDTGLKWNVRGCYAGQYKMQVSYVGQVQASTCSINIPAEYPLENGWDWISLYTASSATSGSIMLKDGMQWVSPMQIDNKNKVVEIRSQMGQLYNDPELGFFGNIESLKIGDGSYKVYSQYEAKNAERMAFNAGYTQLSDAWMIGMRQVQKGYTWVTYPHETDHSMEALNSYLARTASNGDMIIGRDGFAEFDGTQWVAPSAFRFKAGKGYIYYSTNPNAHTLNWGSATLPSDAAEARGTKRAYAPAWQYNPYQYADCMAIVAQLDGIDDPENYSVGAFVDGECRGQSQMVANGLLYIAVAGQTGEQVSFQLYHTPSQQYLTVESQQISFAGRAGSLRAPIALHPDVTGIAEVMSKDNNLSFSIADNQVLVNGTNRQPIITVTDALGKLVMRQQGMQAALPRLAHGVYLISVSDGLTHVVKKLKK